MRKLNRWEWLLLGCLIGLILGVLVQSTQAQETYTAQICEDGVYREQTVDGLGAANAQWLQLYESSQQYPNFNVQIWDASQIVEYWYLGDCDLPERARTTAAAQTVVQDALVYLLGRDIEWFGDD